jgi:hypothetical protein
MSQTANLNKIITNLHSPPSNAEVKNAWSYTSTTPYVFMAWCLVKHRHNFTFHLTVTKKNTALVLLKTTLCNKRQMTQYSQKSLQVRPDLPKPYSACPHALAACLLRSKSAAFHCVAHEHHYEKSERIKTWT